MDLAVKAGLNLFTVAKLEQDQREPAWGTVQALTKALGVSCETFMMGEAPQAEPEPPAGPGEGKKPRKGKGGAK
jgi:hypothetical protein